MRINAFQNTYPSFGINRTTLIKKDELARLLDEGKTVPELIEIYKSSGSAVSYYIKEYGLLTARQRKHSQNIEQYETLLRQGLRAGEISKKLNIEPSTISQWCKKSKLPTPTEFKRQILSDIAESRLSDIELLKKYNITQEALNTFKSKKESIQRIKHKIQKS